MRYSIIFILFYILNFAQSSAQSVKEIDSDALKALTYTMNDTTYVVNFWASWCPPCRAEHPQLVQAADYFSDKGVRFISIDHEDRDADAIQFLDELGRSANQIVVVDEGSRAGIEFGIFGLPATFFVNPAGVIVGKIIGPVDFATVVSIVAQIEAGDDVGVRTTGETFQGPDS